ncbi:hypothetical protein CMUST_09780 [Corynebacterium mustelae]|uniref:Uncharacterized protein n=1 Tax=Corynebacterium mustelae TaxID=571915 RepID=A0A0G3H593_9CORY|nr:hypothetical protein [Corynebacterium mustelae]AKK06272.1 hypothetical protein CMUST_09780 [Corynebacterium mustelae]
MWSYLKLSEEKNLLIEYHPDAPRPQFMWSASLPSTWRIIETHPARWKVCAERLVRDYIPGVRLSASDRKLVMAKLEEVVAQSQKTGVLLALVQPGIVDEQVSAVTLLLRWVDTAPSPASVLAIEKELTSKDPQVERTGNDVPYVVASTSHQAGPITNRRTVFTHQAYIPVSGTSWTLAVSATAPNKETSESVAAIVRRVVEGIKVYPDTAGERILAEPMSEDDIAMVMTEDGVVKP